MRKTRQALIDAIQDSGFTRKEVTAHLCWPSDRLGQLIHGAPFNDDEAGQLASILGRFVHELYDRPPLEEAYWSDNSEDQFSVSQNDAWWHADWEQKNEKRREKASASLRGGSRSSQE